jgi:hypothetical protein
MENSNNKRRRRFAFTGFIIFLLSITIGCSSLLIGGISSSSSSSDTSSSETQSSTSSSTASSSTASSSSSSSASSSASSSTASSSVASSSSSSSINGSSLPVDGPRLAQLGSETVNIRQSVKNGVLEFFIWADGTNLFVSVFQDELLIDNHEIGLTTENMFMQSKMVAYKFGILFTVTNTTSGTYTTFYYTELGIQETFANAMILDGSASIRESGIYLAIEIENVIELHQLVSPSLVSTKMMDLPLDNFYLSFSDIYNGLDGVQYDLGDNYRVFMSMNMGTNMPTFEFYTVDSITGQPLDKMFDHSIMDQKTVFVTDNAIFLHTMPLLVSRYDLSGTRTDYTSVSPRFFPEFQGLVIPNMSGGANVFFEGIEQTIIEDGAYFAFTNSIEEGSSFLMQNNGMNTLSVHEFNSLGYSVIVTYSNAEAINIQTSYSDVVPQILLYQSETDKTTVGYFDNGYVELELPGDLTGSYINHFMILNSVIHAVVYDTESITDPDAFEMNIYNGTVNDDTVLTLTFTDLDIEGLLVLGTVDSFMILNINSGISANDGGYLVNLETLTYIAIGEDIWYIGNQNGSQFQSVFYIDQGFIHGYSWAGHIRLSIADPTNLFTTSEGLNTDVEVTYLDVSPDQLGINQDVLILSTSPFPSTGETTLEIYSGDMTTGFINMDLIATETLQSDVINNVNLILTADGAYLVDFYGGVTITTLSGTPYNGSFYVQDDVIVLIDAALNETITPLTQSMAFPIY